MHLALVLPANSFIISNQEVLWKQE